MDTEEIIGRLLAARGWTLATAESCTGGLVAHRITNVPGSSAYYRGGWIAYANEAKEQFLGVRHQTLVDHGAVSEEVAREMARGARERLRADMAVAVTGVAGPGGGSPEKPVGLVYVALAAPGGELCERRVWHGDRLSNKEHSAQVALELVQTYLEGSPRARRAETAHRPFELIREPVSVEVRQRPDGTALPLAFVWRSRTYRIESWGREEVTPEQDGARRCYLVQTPGPETWELCQEQGTAAWTLTRRWSAGSRGI